MTYDVTTSANCTTHATKTRNGFTRFWPRPRGRGWSDPHTRYAGGADVAVSLARVPR
ncbi:MAG TPA: hypothetical protein VH442_05180 [Micromonosporaceae bacterium]|jgi:hypothetical protein